MPRPQQPGLVYRLFIGNWRNKGTSLMFAVLIWAFAFDNTKQTEEFTVTVRIVSSDPTKVVLRTEHPETKEEFPVSVTVKLKGPRNLLKRINESEPFLEGVFRVGATSIVQLKRDEAFEGLPRGVTVEEVTPREVNVVLDDLGRRPVVIAADIPGTPSRRFRPPTVEDVEITPREVEIVGPSSLIDNYRVRTERWPIEGLDEAETERMLPLVLQRGQGAAGIHREVRFAENTPASVSVRIRLKSALEDGGPYLVPVLFAIPPDTNRAPMTLPVADPVVEMVCRGTPAALAELNVLVKAGAISIYVDVRDFSGKLDEVDATRLRFAEGSLPAGIERSSIRFKPDLLLYRVEMREEKTDE